MALELANLKSRNYSLLTECIWRFHLDKEALWRKVIMEKYGISNDDCLSSNSSLHTSQGPWCIIFNLEDLCSLGSSAWLVVVLTVAFGKIFWLVVAFLIRVSQTFLFLQLEGVLYQRSLESSLEEVFWKRKYNNGLFLPIFDPISFLPMSLTDAF